MIFPPYKYVVSRGASDLLGLQLHRAVSGHVVLGIGICVLWKSSQSS